MTSRAKLFLRDVDEFLAVTDFLKKITTTEEIDIDTMDLSIAMSPATYRTPMDDAPLQGETLGGRMMRFLTAYREARYKIEHTQDELELERTLQDGEQQES